MLTPLILQNDHAHSPPLPASGACATDSATNRPSDSRPAQAERLARPSLLSAIFVCNAGRSCSHLTSRRVGTVSSCPRSNALGHFYLFAIRVGKKFAHPTRRGNPPALPEVIGTRCHYPGTSLQPTRPAPDLCIGTTHPATGCAPAPA